MTFNTDRLMALAGIAGAVRRTTDEVYLAGLWLGEESLFHGLLWMSGCDKRLGSALPHDVMEHRRQPHGYAPSWSWASVTGCVAFVERKYEVPGGGLAIEARLVSAGDTGKPSSKSSAVSEAKLVIRGFLAPVSLVKQAGDTISSTLPVPAIPGYQTISEKCLPRTAFAGATRYGRQPMNHSCVGEGIDQDDFGSYLCDTAVLDVDDLLEADLTERHFFLMIAYSSNTSEDLSPYDELPKQYQGSPAARAEIPNGLLLRSARSEPSSFERIGLVHSRLRARGWELWKDCATESTIEVM